MRRCISSGLPLRGALAGSAVVGSVLVGSVLAILLAAGPAQAQSERCADLWTSRNEIYKARGYCFRTQRAIDAFGNAGCQYDAIEDVPLSANDRRTVADIVRQERELRCPR